MDKFLIMNSHQLLWDGNFWSTTKYLPCLKKEIQISIFTDSPTGNQPTPRQLEVLDSILTINSQEFNHHAHLYLQKVEASIDFQEEGIEIDVANIDRHYTLTTLLIGLLEECTGSYFFMQGVCDWGIEHGIEFLCDGESILSCGAAEGKFVFAHSDDSYRRMR
jgi:hypothetical protein